MLTMWLSLHALNLTTKIPVYAGMQRTEIHLHNQSNALHDIG